MLDIRTLAVATLCADAIFLVFLFLLPRRFDLNNVLVELRRATLFALCGMAGHAVRGFAPAFLSVYLSNFFLLVSLLCYGRAIRRLRGWRVFSRLDLLIGVLYLALYIPHTFIWPAWQQRTIIFAALFLAPTLRNALALLRPALADPAQHALARFVAVVISLDALYRFFVIVPWLALGLDRSPDLPQAGPLMQVSVLLTAANYLLMNLGLLWLVFSRLTVELRESLEARERLLELVAHDLRNPFAVILGNAEQLCRVRHIPDEPTFRRYGQTMLRSATRAHDLLENLLLWGRRDNLAMQARQHELLPLARHACAHAAAGAAAKSITFAVTVPAGPTVYADANMLTAIIRNLAGNAVKFTPEGGSITVSAQAVDAGVEIAVSNTGSAYPPAVCSALAAGRAPSSTRGTAGEMGSGLGLQLVRDFLARHGSELCYNRPPDSGSRFSFVLTASAP